MGEGFGVPQACRYLLSSPISTRYIKDESKRSQPWCEVPDRYGNNVKCRELYGILQNIARLHKSSVKRHLYDGTTVFPLGETTIDFTFRDRIYPLCFQIVETNQPPLPSAKASQQLGLVTPHVDESVNNINKVTQSSMEPMTGEPRRIQRCVPRLWLFSWRTTPWRRQVRYPCTTSAEKSRSLTEERVRKKR